MVAVVFDLNNKLANTLLCLEDNTMSHGFFNILDISVIVAAAAGCKVIKTVPENSEKFFELMKLPLYQITDAIESYTKTGVCFVKKAENAEILKIALSFGIDYLFCSCNVKEKLEETTKLLQNTGFKTACLLHSAYTQTGIASSIGETQIIEIHKPSSESNAETKKYLFSPQKYGIKEAQQDSLTGATPLYNANLAAEILSRQRKDAKTDTITINAGIMIYTCGKAKNITEGIMKAYSALDKGEAMNLLKRFQELY